MEAPGALPPALDPDTAWRSVHGKPHTLRASPQPELIPLARYSIFDAAKSEIRST